jgi:hypothetical protein
MVLSTGGAVAGLMAAVMALKRRQIIHSYRSVGAISESTARSHRELGIGNSAIFRRLVRRGVLKQVPSGHHYLDLEAEVRDESRRHGILAVMLVVVAVGLALVFWFDSAG